jgi:hypothetical protein
VSAESRQLLAAIRTARTWRELNDSFAQIQMVPRLDVRARLYREYERRLATLEDLSRVEMASYERAARVCRTLALECDPAMSAAEIEARKTALELAAAMITRGAAF